MNPETEGQVSVLTNKILSFHRLTAFAMIFLLFASAIAINRPWKIDSFQSYSPTNELILGMIDTELGKTFNYLQFAFKMAENSFRMTYQPKITFNQSSNLSFTQPAYRCSNSSLPCLLTTQATTLQQKFVTYFYTDSTDLNSMMQCIQGDCWSQNGLSLMAKILWQYRINDFLIADNIYIATKLSNQTKWNWAVYPAIGDRINQNLLNQIASVDTDWATQQIIDRGNSDIFLSRKTQVQVFSDSNLKFQIAIMAHLNPEIFGSKIKEYISGFFKQSDETNIRILQVKHSWISYVFDQTIRFPRNPSDLLQKTYKEIKSPKNESNNLLIFQISRYETEIEEGSAIEPHFSSYLALLPMLLALILVHYQGVHIRQYIQTNFSKIEIINKLYKFNINEMFQGRKPKSSLVMQSGEIYSFYEKLSQLPDQGSGFGPILPCSSSRIKAVKKEPFKFQWVIKNISVKYKDFCRPVLEQKNRQIMNNKFFINSSLNQISENEAKTLKEYFLRTKELGMTQPFFKFAYLSLLKNPQVYDEILSEDISPLPVQMTKLFRKINRTVRSQDIRRAFKFQGEPKTGPQQPNRTYKEFNNMGKGSEEHQKDLDGSIVQHSPQIKGKKKGKNGHIYYTTEEQLQIRVQCNLLLKYLVILKDLDIHNTQAKQLGLQKQIWNLSETIQNVRYLISKHNKNIRTYYK